jgi:hypothetical protein
MIRSLARSRVRSKLAEGAILYRQAVEGAGERGVTTRDTEARVERHVSIPGAAASLREGFEETLTLQRLGIRGSLKTTLASTNPRESMIECVRRTSRNVKRWQSGDMALRWTAAGMLKAERQFRRVNSETSPWLLALLLALLGPATLATLIMFRRRNQQQTGTVDDLNTDQR